MHPGGTTSTEEKKASIGFLHLQVSIVWLCTDLLALSALTSDRQSIMTNLFAARTASVFRHAQDSCASDRETPPLSRVSTANPNHLSADPSRSHAPSAHASFTKTPRLLAAYA